MIRLRSLLFAFAALLVAPLAHAQTGQTLYNIWCSGCHGPAAQNQNNVQSGKDWNVIKLAMDSVSDMRNALRPSYNSGDLTDANFQTIATYLATFGGGATSQLSMPSAFSFGTQTVGVGSSVVAKNVSSTGNAAVQISSVNNSNPAEFSIVSTTCTAGAFVNPLSSCSISVQFTPIATGARSGTITIASNGLGSPQTIGMSGTGQSGTPPPPSGLSVPSTLNLGSQAVGVQSAGSTLNVSNPGASAVTVLSVNTSSVVEFPLLALTCGVVNAGANCSVTVGFKPQAAGVRSGTLTITDNGTGSPHTVSLSGTGTGGGGTGANKVQAIEYFNAQIGHFFLTAQADEQFGLDNQLLPGWVRTGNFFNVWDAQAAGTSAVFRLFTVKFASKAAHFYTANVAERDLRRTENGGDWTYEKIAYYLQATATGVCNPGDVPIYRMFNNGQTGAPNHRFTTSQATYIDFTTTKNWAGEGVVFCAPP